MQTIAIRLRARELCAEMAEMRKWLDEHRCEPANFTFRRFGDIISIYAVFREDADGEAFKARFYGRPGISRCGRGSAVRIGPASA
jgi:hypothetical protein